MTTPASTLRRRLRAIAHDRWFILGILLLVAVPVAAALWNPSPYPSVPSWPQRQGRARRGRHRHGHQLHPHRGGTRPPR